MKLLHTFSLLFVALIAFTSAQVCGPRRPSCQGPPNFGRSGRGCIAGTRWYYESRSRQCREMRYLGCGGNNNRYCFYNACIRRCRR